MKLDRIPSISSPRQVLPRAERAPPRPGESLLLTYEAAEGTDLLATLSNGMSVRLTGPALWRGELQPGDILRAKVLSTDRGLELELEGAVFRGVAEQEVADADLSPMSRHAAMRMDQAALRQMAWQAPDAAALASSWRQMALERWVGRLPDPDAGSAGAKTTMMGPPPFREPAATWMPPGVNQWQFPVYAWGGMQMLLGRVDSEDAKSPGKRRRTLILRLELAPLALGRVALQVQWVASGILLEIAVEHAEAATIVRDALPTIVAAMLRAGLRLTSFRLTQGAVAVSGFSDTPRLQVATQPSSLSLFRALAETAVVLLQAVPGMSQQSAESQPSAE
jgi:hypothetical protein